MNITYQSLVDLGACSEGLTWFREHLGDEADVYTCIDAARKHGGEAYMEWAVARHPLCPAEILVTLSRDENASVRCAVAEHPLCPAEILANLSRDENADVRWAVAEHPLCPAEILAILSGDKNAFVRWAVAEHVCRN